MTARPSHAAQQVQIDDALEAVTPSRWGWLFTPDPKWLSAVNTTTYREVNAVRMFVGVSVLWNGLASAVTTYAMARCHIDPSPLAKGETVASVRQLCEESHATSKLLDFASGLFESYGYLLAAMASIAIGAMLGKRATDTEHRERVEQAKKAPVILPQGVVTAEHQAQAPQVTNVVNVGEDAVSTTETPKPGPRTPAPDPKEPDLYTDDERGDG